METDKEVILRGRRSLGLVATVIGAILLSGIFTIKAKKGESQEKTHTQGLIWSDTNKREYASLVKSFYGGAEQKIYVDRRPFGTLDAVRTEVYPNGARPYFLEERLPEAHEEEVFGLLEMQAKREHPALF